LSLAGKLLGASLLVAACLSITAGTAFTQAPPAKKVQIKIVIDSKEIDLTDANLGALLQAAQAKPKPDATPKENKKPDDAIQFKFWLDDHVEKQKQGEKAMIWKIVGDKVVTAQAQTAAAPQPYYPDPRINELVRAAHSIKPGSGADVRRALEAKPKPTAYYGNVTKPATIAIQAAHGDAAHGKHVIVVTIDAATGKVLNVVNADTKKAPLNPLAGHDIDMRFSTKPNDPAAAKQEHQKAVEALLKALQEHGMMKVVPAPPATPPPVALPIPPTPFAKPAPPTPAPQAPLRAVPAAPDVEALGRQLERITRELQELRQRLDANKAAK